MRITALVLMENSHEGNESFHVDFIFGFGKPNQNENKIKRRRSEMTIKGSGAVVDRELRL